MNMINILQKILCNNQYYINRIRTLTIKLAQSITPIEIKQKIETEINPWNIIKGYDLEVADEKYYTFNIYDWKNIILILHNNLKEKYKYQPEIFDCDDIALLYFSVLSYSAYYKSGLEHQPAMAIAWSNLHAFNLIIDNKNNIWIVEPQNGTIIGKINDKHDKIYDVKKIWFMG